MTRSAPRVVGTVVVSPARTLAVAIREDDFGLKIDLQLCRTDGIERTITINSRSLDDLLAALADARGELVRQYGPSATRTAPSRPTPQRQSDARRRSK